MTIDDGHDHVHIGLVRANAPEVLCRGGSALRWRISRSAGPAMLERRLQPVVILLEISLRFPIMVLCNGHDHRRPRLAVRRQAG